MTTLSAIFDAVFENTAAGAGSALSAFLVTGVGTIGFRYGRTSPAYARCCIRRALKRPMKRFELRPPESRWRNDRLEAPIRTAINNRTSGVQVLHTEPGTGKTTASRDVIRDLQLSRKISGALLVKCSNISMNNTQATRDTLQTALRRELFRVCGVPQTSRAGFNVSSLFPHNNNNRHKRSVLLLDQFDHVTNWDTKEVCSLVKAFAEDAAQSNSFVVVANVSDRALFKDMITWNGAQKITSMLPEDEIFEWSDEELRSVLLKHIACRPRLSALQSSKAEQDQLIANARKEPKGKKTVGALLRQIDSYLENLPEE